MLNSLGLATAATLLQVGTSAMAAYAFARIEFVASRPSLCSTSARS